MKKLTGRFGIFILLLFTLSLLALLFGCNSPNDPFNYNEYFPLRVGNKWYYNKYYYPDSTDINFLIKLTKQKVIDNKTYIEAVSTDLTAGLSDTTYCRINDDTFFIRKPGTQERIFADFSLKLNDTAYWDQNFKVLAKDYSEITFGTASGSNVGLFVTFRRGVGIIKLIDNGFVYHKLKLIKAELK